ncbi:5471_t:CDS:2 [Ambispora leptoticha]|uniref:5471_t:CDS:1 n=1 Tax=Ambispora leptoticha TaxID=144679 RepID=A0A9N9AZ63_9GLOM|nr:5471_t:CDS:2 [Ambispora leptoticha]
MQAPSEKKTGNRYVAKCKYCLLEQEGKLERLHQHVLRCNSWPVSEKTSYLQKATEKTTLAHKRNKSSQEELIETTSELAEPSVRQKSILNWCTKSISSVQSEKLYSKLLNAIIYGNLSFNFVENLYIQDFLQELAPSYQLPSIDMLRGRILTRSFSNYVQKKLTTMSTFTDATICLDGWTDISENSIYRFMVLKEHEEHVIDIVDLSANRHRASFIKNKFQEIFVSNGFQISSAIACVTDNPSVMELMKNLLKSEHPNIIPIRCCLYAFNLIVKNIVGFASIVSTCNNNQNFRYHYATNDILIKIIKPVVDAIGRLESRDTTLADVFKELIYIHLEISKLEEDSISGFKAHALTVISRRAREFSNDIYFIALFLSPVYKSMAISKHMNGDRLLRGCLELARVWMFDKRDASLLFKELINYKDNNPPFDRISPNIQQSPRSFWTRNRLSPDTLSKLVQIKNELQQIVSKKKQKDKQKTISIPEPSEENVSLFFKETDDELEGPDELNEQIEIVNVEEEASIMEEFFDFEMFQKDQKEFSLIEEVHDPATNIVREEWSIEDILQNQ